MPGISVREFSRFLGAGELSGMALKVGLRWPPPPPVSVRNLASLVGLPVVPNDFAIAYGEFIDGKLPPPLPPDSNGVPVKETVFEWRDPGWGSVRQATSWEIQIKKHNTGEVFEQFRGEQKFPNGQYTISKNLDYSTAYSWNVVLQNACGSGPSSPAFVFVTMPKEPVPTPTPTPTPTGDKTLTLVMSIDSGSSTEVTSPALISVTWSLAGQGVVVPPGSFSGTPLDAQDFSVPIPLPPPTGAATASVQVSASTSFTYVDQDGTNQQGSCQLPPFSVPWMGLDKTVEFTVSYIEFPDSGSGGTFTITKTN